MPQVLEFVRAMAAAPASPLLASPQLADFYVHHHFLQFARLYHAALASPRGSGGGAMPSGAAAARGGRRGPAGAAAAALRACRGHLGVLLELACRSPGGGGVRRRYSQLHVLDFLLRELSLEHGARHQARTQRAAAWGVTGRGAHAGGLQWGPRTKDGS